MNRSKFVFIIENIRIKNYFITLLTYKCIMKSMNNIIQKI